MTNISDTRHPWLRSVELGAIPLALVVAFLIMCLGCAGHMPDPIATHWGEGNMPDGSTDDLTLFLLGLGILIVAWLVPCLEIGLRYTRGCRRMYTLPVAYYILTIIPVMAIGVIRANMRVLVWESARGLGRFSIVVTGLVPAVMFVVGYSIETDYYRFKRASGERSPKLWEGHSSNWWIRLGYVCVFLLCFVVGTLVGIAGNGSNSMQLTIVIAVLEAILVGCCCLGASTHIKAYEGGVIITLGFLGVIHRKIPMEHIRRCVVTSVDIKKLHGLFIIHHGKVTGYIVKSGQGILIDIEDVASHDIIVNCDDPHTGVEKINYGIGVLKEASDTSIVTGSDSCSKIEP